MQNPEPRRGLQFVVGLVLTLLICALSYLLFDRLAINYFLAADPSAINFFHHVTFLGDSLYSLLIGAGLYLFCRFRQQNIQDDLACLALERWKLRGLFLFSAVISSGLLVILFKYLCGRPRPIKLLTENLYDFSLFETSAKMLSFPSGHSNTAVAIALVLWYLWPKSWPIGLLLAGGVILSRVVLLKHYPSDALAGAYVAVVTTFYLHQFFRRRFPALFSGNGA